MTILAVAPPVLTPYYKIIFWVMIIQALIVLLVGVVGISLQWYLKKQKERQQKSRSKIKEMLLLLSEKDTPFDSSAVDKELFNASLLLPVMLQVDSTLDREKYGKGWGNVQTKIQEKYLRPYAQKLAYKRHWTKKLKAVRCFAMAPNPEDEEAIIHLIHEKTPIVKYAAAQVAGKIATEKSLDAILSEMNQSTHYLRHPFHDALLKGGEKTFRYLEERLRTEKNPYTKVSCYEVLSERMTPQAANFAINDLNASEKNLRIASIKALGHFKDKKSIEALISKLNDAEWEVRALAARSLGYLAAEEAIPQLVNCCGDREWWVRMNSALALKRMGASGIHKLQQMSSATDRFAAETAQYVLALQESDDREEKR